MHQASLVQAPGIIYAPVYLLSVPPVPAIFCLILLVALAPLIKKFFGSALDRKELVFIYIVLVIAIPPVTFGISELMLSYATAPGYFNLPTNNMQMLAEAMPQWMHPQNPEAIRTMYEGSVGGGIPWKEWVYPLTIWTVFLVLIFFTSMCIVTLFRKQWAENERLRYPLLFIPMSVIDREAPGSNVPFFQNRLVWLGCGLVILHHLMNVANAYDPSVIALGDRSYFFQTIFTEHPWTVFRNIAFFHRPQVIGLAYFVPLDILFSGWFFYLLIYIMRFLSEMFGVSAAPGFPFNFSQAAGAYAGLAAVLFWVGRDELAKIARKAFTGDPSIDDSNEPMPYRWSMFGAIGGFAALVIWANRMGLPWSYSLLFFAVMFIASFVFARIRAEAGVPTMWGPAPKFTEHVQVLLGTKTLVSGQHWGGIAVLHTFNFIARGYLGSMSAYHTENEELARRVNLRERIVPIAMIVAFIVGLVVAYPLILGSYYEYGATLLHGGERASGGYHVLTASRQWRSASNVVDQAAGMDLNRSIAMGAAFLATIGMVALRWRWLRAPFHPLGYASCIWYGYALWAPFFVTWVLKGLVHRLGGARLYRQLMPFFLGMAFGDLLAGGISWVIMGIFGGDIFNGYMVQFG
jgi:hypothetical protein